MKPNARRLKVLDRLTRCRQIERLRALNDLAAAGLDSHRLEQLCQRSQSMLDGARHDVDANDASELAALLAFRGQLASLTRSTEQMRADAVSRVVQAREHLRKAEKRLELVEERSSATARALAGKSRVRSAQEVSLAHSLQFKKQIRVKQGIAS